MIYFTFDDMIDLFFFYIFSVCLGERVSQIGTVSKNQIDLGDVFKTSCSTFEISCMIIT